jgi:thiamine biosynthesis protein ThiS
MTAMRNAEREVRSAGERPDAACLKVVVNGQPRELQGPTTVAALLGQLEVPLRGVAVELNLQVVPRSQHAEQLLADGDRLEIVSLVGGG